MSRRILSLPAVLFVLLIAVPTFAHSNVIAQQSSKKATGAYLHHDLIPGHRYRFEVVSSGHRQVVGMGFEYYTYLQNHRLYAGQKTLHLQGKTPISLTFSQPISNKPAEWTFAMTVTIRNWRGITLRLYDLGK